MKVLYNTSDRILTNIAEKFAARLKQDVTVTLAIDENLGEFESEIQDGVIRAGSYGSLFDAAGRFLRHPEVKGRFVSQKKMPGMYLTTHFNNYYDATPLPELFDYIDDLAFWGMGILSFWFDMHHYRNMEEAKPQTDRLLKLITYANSIGIKVACTMLSSEAFADSPKELRADWTSGHDGYIHDLNDHYHVELCPSVPGGLDKILEYRREMLEVFQEAKLDYVKIGAYDEGGCTCSACAPWGGNGHLRCLDALIPLIKEYFPKVEVIGSLWQFGTFTGTTVEYEILADELAKGRFPDLKYLMSEPGHATYAVTHDMHRPIIGFPEISMPAANPWGGYGANPLPQTWQKEWDKYGESLEGGFPYSEGIYEDMNKAIFLRFYRDGQPALTTVKEYLAYEFGLEGELLDLMFQTVLDMEWTLSRIYTFPYARNQEGVFVPNPKKTEPPHRYVIRNPERVFRIEEAVKKVHAALPESIREGTKWQVLYLRGLIDAELARNDFYRNDVTLGYFKKLVAISHLENSGQYTKPDIEE